MIGNLAVGSYPVGGFVVVPATGAVTVTLALGGSAVPVGNIDNLAVGSYPLGGFRFLPYVHAVNYPNSVTINLAAQTTPVTGAMATIRLPLTAALVDLVPTPTSVTVALAAHLGAPGTFTPFAVPRLTAVTEPAPSIAANPGAAVQVRTGPGAAPAVVLRGNPAPTVAPIPAPAPRVAPVTAPTMRLIRITAATPSVVGLDITYAPATDADYTDGDVRAYIGSIDDGTGIAPYLFVNLQDQSLWLTLTTAAGTPQYSATLAGHPVGAYPI